MSTKIFKFAAVMALLIVVGLSGCRAGGGLQQPGIFQQPGVSAGQPGIGRQLGQRAGNIAFNRLINAGITRAITGF